MANFGGTEPSPISAQRTGRGVHGRDGSMRLRSTMPYRIEYDPKTHDHFAYLSTHERVTVLDKVERQLLHQPTTPTRNRKLLRASALAPWELRIGHLRVYYEVSDGHEPVVTVRAVGIKVRNRVLIGGVEVEP